MHPALVVAPQDTAADLAALDRLAALCERFTPLVAVDPPDGLLLDISGCAHLFGGERALIDDLSARVVAQGFTLRVAVAGTIGAAWAAARFSKATVLPPGEERDLLAPLPLAALRLPPETVAALGRVGLKRIGDIVDRPRAPLAARFGDDLLVQLDRALDLAREPLTPRLPVAPYVAEKSFAEPIAREDDVLTAAERLAARLCTMLERRGAGARRIELVLFRTDGAVRRLAVGTSRPLRDPAAIRKLFVERLAALGDDLDPGFGFDLMRLAVNTAEPLAPAQVGLGDDAAPGEIDHLVDRLSARLGTRRVGRLVAADSHVPEAAALVVPAQAVAALADPGWAALRAHRAAVDLAPRPLRLLAVPEPVEAIAAVPDGPPLRFRWRRVLHEVVAAEGPERIEDAWWGEDGGPARDYFRVEARGGRRFWLYRAGLFRDTAAPRWFLHGTFG